MTELQGFIASRTPSGWETRPLWSLFRRRKLTGYADEELLSVYRDYGVIPKSSRDDNHNKESDDLSGYQLVTKGSLVTNKMKAWQGSIAISRYRGIVSPAYYVYEPLSAECDQFLHYLLRSEPYIALYGRISKGVRVNQWDLEHEALRNVPVMLPDLDTQKAIADFLDRETARIDQLIEKKQRLLEVLREKRLATLERLAAQRIPQNVTFRRVLKKIEQGWSPECYARGVEGDEWGVLKVGCVNGWSFNYKEHKALPDNMHPRPELEVRDGDILMSRANTPELVGSVSLVSAIPRRLMLCDKLYRLRLDTNLVDPRFAVMFLRSRKARDHYASSSNGASSTMQNIGQEVVRSLQFPLPPLTEQKLRVEEFEALNSKIEKTVDKTTRSIERLREYRSSLITAAVTGQIDVATWGKHGQTDRRLDEIEEAMQA